MKTANFAIENEASRYTTEPLAQKWAATRQTLSTWKDRVSTRRALRGLSPEMLKDIGMDKYDAIFEADKPFWRE